MRRPLRISLLIIACMLAPAAWMAHLPADEGDGGPELESPADTAAIATAAEVNDLQEVNALLERANRLKKTGAPGTAVDIYLDIIDRYITTGGSILASEDGVLFRTLRNTVLARLANIGNADAVKRISIIAESRAQNLLGQAESTAEPVPLLRLLGARYPFTRAGGVGLEMLSHAAFEAGDYPEVIQCFRDMQEFGSEKPDTVQLLKWYAAATALGDAAEVARVRRLCKPHVQTPVELGGRTMSLEHALELIDRSVPPAPASVYVFNSHVETTPQGVKPFAASSISKRNSAWGPVTLDTGSDSQPDSFPVIAGNYLVIAERHKAIAFDLNTGKRQHLAGTETYLPQSSHYKYSLMPLGAAADGAGRVFVTMGWCNLHAFDATGRKIKPLWDTGINSRTIKYTPFNDFVFASLPVTDGRRVYIIAREYREYISNNKAELLSKNEAELLLVAYNASSGKLIYAKPICTALANTRLRPQYLPSTITIHKGAVLVSTNAGVIGAMRASDGEILWLRRYGRRVEAFSTRMRHRRWFGKRSGVDLALIPPLSFERTFGGQTERLALFAPADSNEVIGTRPESGALVLVEPRAKKNFALTDKSNRIAMYAGGLGDELPPKVARKTAIHLARKTPAEPTRRLVVGYDAFEFVRRWYVKCPAASACGYGLSVGDSWYIPGGEVLYRLHPESASQKPDAVDKNAYPDLDRFSKSRTHLLAAPGRVILFNRQALQCFKAVPAE